MILARPRPRPMRSVARAAAGSRQIRCAALFGRAARPLHSLGPRKLQLFRLQRLVQRTAPLVRALWGSNNDATPSNEPSARRQALLSFVNGLTPSPDGTAGFDMAAPVVAAVRQTVTNLLGTLPPQFFKVTISTRSDNLAQLMFSVLMTGYMFCNGWYRLQLTQSMGALSRPATAPTATLVGSTASGSYDEDDFSGGGGGGGSGSFSGRGRMAAGAQKVRVEGEVLRWHHEDGVQQMPALEYIEQLEAELEALQMQVATQRAAMRAAEAAAAAAAAGTTAPRSAFADTAQNELLEYLKGLSGDQVTELTDCATPDVLEAMNALVRRLIGEEGGDGSGEWGRGKTECTAPELAQLLCFLMAVGHQLRTMEVRLSLLASLDTVNSGGDNGLGPDDGAGGPPSADWVPRLPPGR